MYTRVSRVSVRVSVGVRVKVMARLVTDRDGIGLSNVQ